jgi:F-type H+-transporting ATPase subunit delta
VLERVRGYADAVIETSGTEISRIAGELESFRSLLAGSDDLESVLTSTYIPLAARRTVVDELLRGKLSPVVVDLLRYAVQDGAAADYQADVDGVTAVAVARRDGRQLVVEPIGRVAMTERLDGYAGAVLAHVERRQLSDIEDDLFRFGHIAAANEELRVALTTPDLDALARAAIVRDLLSGKASPQAIRMAAYAALWARPRDYLVMVEVLTERVAREADRRVADVRSAVELNEAERQRLAAALTRYTGHQVDVRVTTQQDLLGGFVASVGDIVVDASLRHRLEEARELLFAPTVSGANVAPAGQPGNGERGTGARVEP